MLDEARAFGAQLVVIDTVSDTFGGDENDRGQVRFYIQAALGGLARALDGAVLATAHPSRAGMLKDGTGDSGSTGWDAGFRSRLSLRTPQPDRDEHGEPLDEADPYARVLQRKKANYAPREDEIELFWKEGVFYPKLSTSGFLGSIDRRRCEDVFLALLDATNSENQPVSSNSRAGNYAPRLFVRRPERDRCKNGDFERAMQRSLHKSGSPMWSTAGRATRAPGSSAPASGPRHDRNFCEWAAWRRLRRLLAGH